jgi:hypothetical protein
MNWYKIAQSLVEHKIVSPEAMKDLSNFRRSLPGKNVTSIRQEIMDAISKYPEGMVDYKKFNVGSVFMFGAAPRTLQSYGYRIGFQICNHVEKNKKQKKYIIIRRVFENHSDYETWYGNRHLWQDYCKEDISDIAGEHMSEAKSMNAPIELDISNPGPWLLHAVSAFESKNQESIRHIKEMLDKKDEEFLYEVVDIINKNKQKIRKDIFFALESLIEKSLAKF